MTAPVTLYTLANAEAPKDSAAQLMALLRQGILEAMEHHKESPQYLTGVPIRFFTAEPIGDMEEEESPDLEMTASDFAWHVAKGYAFSYERNTVRENGVSQIILTLTEGGI